MKVVNIVPVDVVGQAKAKMFVVVGSSLQRWNEKGRESEENIEEGDGENEVDMPRRNTYEEEEEEEEDVGNLRQEYGEEEDEDIQTPQRDPVHELEESSEDGEEVDNAPHGRSPVGHVHDLREETPPHKRSPVGHVHDLGEEIPPPWAIACDN